MISGELSKITRNTLEALRENQVSESRTLEYKRDLYSLKDVDTKREFLADVSAFANSGGGDILCGMDETDGLPTALRGQSFLFDEIRLQMSNLLRDGLEPSLIHVNFHVVDLGDGKAALVIRIPQSLLGPHRVVLGGHGHFYFRGSGSRERMDVPALRSAFLLSETIGERIRGFRADRVTRIAIGDTPTKVEPRGKVVFHIIPLSAFSGLPVDISLTREQRYRLLLPNARSARTKINIDGFVAYDGDDECSDTYLQFFRTGIIELVKSVETSAEDKGWFVPGWYEESFIQAAEQYFDQLSSYGIGAPFYLMLSFCDVKGLRLYVGRSYLFRGNPVADRNTLLLPEAAINERDAIRRAMIGLYAITWNAFGQEELLSFDASGNYVNRH